MAKKKKKDSKQLSLPQIREQYALILENMTLMDDILFNAALEDQPEAVHLIFTILSGDPDLQMSHFRFQEYQYNLLGRSIITDLTGLDTENNHYDVEVQQQEKELTPQRIRVHRSALDRELIRKNSRFKEIYRSKIFFISETDYGRSGLPKYRLLSHLEGSSREYDDGSEVIIVNGQYRGNDDLGWLMHDFFCADPDKMHFQVLADAVKCVKRTVNGKDGGHMTEATLKRIDKIMFERYGTLAQVSEEAREAREEVREAREEVKEAREETRKERKKARKAAKLYKEANIAKAALETENRSLMKKIDTQEEEIAALHRRIAALETSSSGS